MSPRYPNNLENSGFITPSLPHVVSESLIVLIRIPTKRMLGWPRIISCILNGHGYRFLNNHNFKGENLDEK